MAHARHQSQAGARVSPQVSDRHPSEQRYDHWVRAVPEYREGRSLDCSRDRIQPSVAAAGLQDGYGALPARFLRAIHEQSGGADSADDKAAHEDLGRVPLGAGSEGLRHAVQRAVDGAEARFQSHLGAPTAADRSAHRAALLAGTSTRTVRLPATPVPGLGMPRRSGIRARQIVGST